MKHKFYFLLLLILLFWGCEKTNYESTGTITGADLAMCACCGGYFIDIEGTNYRFEKSELPAGFTFNDEQMPFRVELDWEVKTETCTGFNWIKISKIRKL
jgi:hypothetical protein